MTQVDLPNYLTSTTIRAAAAIASTANGSVVMDLVGYEGKVAAVLSASNATAGTNPTLDLVVKTSSDNSTWSNAGIAFTQITAATQQTLGIDTRDVERYIRVDSVIGGTNSPSFPVSIVAVGVKQYNQT